LEQLAAYTEKEIAALYGLGKSTIVSLAAALKTAGLEYKKPKK